MPLYPSILQSESSALGNSFCCAWHSWSSPSTIRDSRPSALAPHVPPAGARSCVRGSAAGLSWVTKKQCNDSHALRFEAKSLAWPAAWTGSAASDGQGLLVMIAGHVAFPHCGISRWHYHRLAGYTIHWYLSGNEHRDERMCVCVVKTCMCACR